MRRQAGRGFCPSCMGRRMSATAASLIERVLPPPSGLRQWVLTFPFSWRRRLAQDGKLLGRLTRVVVETVLTFYAARAAQEGGARREDRRGHRSAEDLVRSATESAPAPDRPRWRLARAGRRTRLGGLGHLRTSEVGEVLERLVQRMERHLRRCCPSPNSHPSPLRGPRSAAIGRGIRGRILVPRQRNRPLPFAKPGRRVFARGIPLSVFCPRTWVELILLQPIRRPGNRCLTWPESY
jgi:hypothetical protein